MKQILLSIALLLTLIPNIQAYRRYGLIGRRVNSVGSIIVSGGPNYCYGDTYGSPYDKSILNGTNWESAIGFRQDFQGNFGYRANLLFGNFTSSDFPNPRNYASATNTIELSGRGEYSYYFGGSDRYRTPNQHMVYGFVGLGVLSCNVIFPSHASTPNHAVMKTRSNFFAPIIPFGMGYSFAINDDFSIGTEIGWKYALSDYLDGYHPVPYSKSNDVLGGVTFTLTYRIFGQKGFLDH